VAKCSEDRFSPIIICDVVNEYGVFEDRYRFVRSTVRLGWGSPIDRDCWCGRWIRGRRARGSCCTSYSARQGLIQPSREAPADTHTGSDCPAPHGGAALAHAPSACHVALYTPFSHLTSSMRPPALGIIRHCCTDYWLSDLRSMAHLTIIRTHHPLQGDRRFFTN